MPLQVPFNPKVNGFNLQATSFVGGPFSVLPQSILPVSVVAVEGGRKIYILDLATSILYEYNNRDCNVNSASFTGISIDLSTVGAFAIGVTVSFDNKRLYVTNVVTQFVYQFNLPEINTLKGAFYSGLSLFIGAQIVTPSAMTISDNDTKLYVCSNAGFVFQYNLADITDVGSGIFSGQLDMTASITSSGGIAINSQGTTITTNSYADTTIYQWDLIIPHEISSGVVSPRTFDLQPYQSVGPIPSFTFSSKKGEYLISNQATVRDLTQYISHNLIDKCL